MNIPRQRIQGFLYTLCVILSVLIGFIAKGIAQESIGNGFINLDALKVFILSEDVDACNSYIANIENNYQDEFSEVESAVLALAKCKCILIDGKSMSNNVCQAVIQFAESIRLETSEDVASFVEIQLFLAERDVQDNNIDKAIKRLEERVLNAQVEGRFNIKVLLQLALIHELKFEYDKAIQYLEKADEYAQGMGSLDYELKHELYNRYASVYSRKDNLDKTKEYVDKNIALVENSDVKNNFHLGNVHNALAKYHFRSSDLVKALYHFEREFEYKSKLVKENKLTDCMMNIANMSSKIGEYDKALDFAERSLVIIQNTYGQKSDRVAHNKFVTGLIFLEQRKYEQSLQYFKECLEIELELFGEKNKGIAFNYIRLADSYFGMDDHEMSITYAKKAIAGFKRHFGEKNQQVSWAYETLIQSAIQNKEYVLARKSVEEAYESLDIDVSRDTLNFESMRLPFLLVHILRLDLQLSLIEFKATQSEEKLAYIDRLERAAFGWYKHLKFNMDEGKMHRLLSIRLSGITKDVIVKNDFLYETTGDQAYLDEILKAIEKGRNNVLIETKIGDELVEFSGVPNFLLQKQIDINDSIAYLTLQLSTLDGNDYMSAQKQIQNRINALKEDQIQLLETLKEDHKDFYALKYDYPVSSIADIQNLCAEKDNWLLFSQTHGNIHLISITKGQLQYHKVPFDTQLKQNILLLKAGLIEKRTDKEFYHLANTLYTTLFGKLALKKGMHLKIFPAGPIHGLPFEILCTRFDENEHSFMLEDYLISYHHSPYLSMHPYSGNKPKQNALLMAPEFASNEEEMYATMEMDGKSLGSSLKSLKGAEEEVLGISAIMHSHSFVGEDASEKRFKEIASNYNILHLASHGFVNHKNPNYSKLVLSRDEENEDGLLHSYEIYGLELHADLVTLSACNTGTGKEELGEGVSSLGRAFAYAGCPNSVMSLWSVNDQSTAKLMTYFYQNLKQGVPKAEALRAAKLEFLEKQPAAFRAPFYWAGFVYYGDNLPLEMSKFNSAGMLSKGWWLLGIFGVFGIFHLMKRKRLS